jgi:3-methyladenine DNA glycosylase AlkD
MATTRKETLAQLEALGNEKVRAQNSKNGAGDNRFGARLGNIRKLAAKIKTNHALAIALWETGNIDARLLGFCCKEWVGTKKARSRLLVRRQP